MTETKQKTAWGDKTTEISTSDRRHCFTRDIPGTLKHVDGICKEIKTFLESIHLENDLFEVSLLAREALVNAVVHGCACDAHKSIHFKITLQDQEMIMDISDPGKGFSWKEQSEKKVALSDEKGRGILIFKHYADKVRFNRTGNRLTMHKWLT